MTRLLPQNATKQLNAAYKTVYRKDTMPVLQHFHLYTEDGWLMVESTNLETASREKIACIVENEFNLCVPARAFKDWMAVLAKSYKVPVKIYTNGLNLYTEVNDNGTRSRTTFHCMTAFDFPVIDKLLPN